LTVAVTNSPVPAALLSWTPIPFTSNYLYAATSPSPLATNWQLVTNFLSPETFVGRVTVADPIKTNAPRYYRLRALAL
jgi:hypothetical protein